MRVREKEKEREQDKAFPLVPITFKFLENRVQLKAGNSLTGSVYVVVSHENLHRFY